MNYHIGHERAGAGLFGAECHSPNKISLYVYKKPRYYPNATLYNDFVANKQEIRFWSKILQHEHLHAILHKVKIPIEEQELVIDGLIGRIIVGFMDFKDKIVQIEELKE